MAYATNKYTAKEFTIQNITTINTYYVAIPHP